MNPIPNFPQADLVPDQRGNLRLQLRLKSTGSISGDDDISVSIHDLSVTGMLIETSVRLAIGAVIHVNLPLTGPAEAKVAWSTGRYFGCQFDEPISKAAVSGALLASEPENQSSFSATSTPIARKAAAQQTLDRLVTRPTKAFSRGTKLLANVALAITMWAIVIWVIFSLFSLT